MAQLYKQMLLETNPDHTPFAHSVTTDAFNKAIAPVWAFLDQLHPHLWRAGKQFPENSAAIRQMMADGELIMALTFNPNEAANEIAAKRLPQSVVSWQFAKGSQGNTHFVAIPLIRMQKRQHRWWLTLLFPKRKPTRQISNIGGSKRVRYCAFA
ncbi:MAG: hypothetical protein IPQ12_10255 [Polaromonas sp.]|nr:hypothetical protein [Polaromonas sp.]